MVGCKQDWAMPAPDRNCEGLAGNLSRGPEYCVRQHLSPGSSAVPTRQTAHLPAAGRIMDIRSRGALRTRRRCERCCIPLWANHWGGWRYDQPLLRSRRLLHGARHRQHPRSSLLAGCELQRRNRKWRINHSLSGQGANHGFRCARLAWSTTEGALGSATVSAVQFDSLRGGRTGLTGWPVTHVYVASGSLRQLLAAVLLVCDDGQCCWGKPAMPPSIACRLVAAKWKQLRSEEHTSELQSL